MRFFVHSKKNGFTLIELLVVMSIIALLSSVILTSLNSARASARDGRRKSDLVQARNALLLYYDRYGQYVDIGSGCGYEGNGDGWFNYFDNVNYQKSSVQCLLDAGIITKEIIDPTGGRLATPSAGYTYMKYQCGASGINRRSDLFAKLEKVPQSATATDDSCCPACDSLYGMNYFLPVQ